MVHALVVEPFLTDRTLEPFFVLIITFQTMVACVVIEFIFVMTVSKITPLHKMRLLVIAEVEELVTGHTL